MRNGEEKQRFVAAALRPGDELCVTRFGADHHYRAIVVIGGGWQKRSANAPVALYRDTREYELASNQVIASYGKNRHDYVFTRTGASGGRYVAVACLYASASDEKRWEPGFVSVDDIVSTWEVEQQALDTKAREEEIAKAKQARQSTIDEDALRALLPIVLPHVSAETALTQFKKQYDPYGSSEGVEWRGAYHKGTGAHSHSLHVYGDALLRLASAVSACSNNNDSTLQIVETLKQENTALLERAQAAEQKLNAIKFLLDKCRE
jgi:hypothetical protein